MVSIQGNMVVLSTRKKTYSNYDTVSMSVGESLEPKLISRFFLSENELSHWVRFEPVCPPLSQHSAAQKAKILSWGQPERAN